VVAGRSRTSGRMRINILFSEELFNRLSEWLVAGRWSAAPVSKTIDQSQDLHRDVKCIPWKTP
jgi:hypothetical protein